MANLTTYGAARAAAGNSVMPASGLYLALGTGQQAAGLLGEPAGGGYARQPVALTVSGAQARNASGAITFSGFTQNLGNFTHWALFDAAGGGNCVWVGALAATVNLLAGGSVTIAPNNLTLSFATAG